MFIHNFLFFSSPTFCIRNSSIYTSQSHYHCFLLSLLLISSGNWCSLEMIPMIVYTEFYTYIFNLLLGVPLWMSYNEPNKNPLPSPTLLLLLNSHPCQPDRNITVT